MRVYRALVDRGLAPTKPHWIGGPEPFAVDVPDALAVVYTGGPEAALSREICKAGAPVVGFTMERRPYEAPLVQFEVGPGPADDEVARAILTVIEAYWETAGPDQGSAFGRVVRFKRVGPSKPATAPDAPAAPSPLPDSPDLTTGALGPSEVK